MYIECCSGIFSKICPIFVLSIPDLFKASTEHLNLLGLDRRDIRFGCHWCLDDYIGYLVESKVSPLLCWWSPYKRVHKTIDKSFSNKYYTWKLIRAHLNHISVFSVFEACLICKLFIHTTRTPDGNGSLNMYSPLLLVKESLVFWLCLWSCFFSMLELWNCSDNMAICFHSITTDCMMYNEPMGGE